LQEHLGDRIIKVFQIVPSAEVVHHRSVFYKELAKRLELEQAASKQPDAIGQGLRDGVVQHQRQYISGYVGQTCGLRDEWRLDQAQSEHGLEAWWLLLRGPSTWLCGTPWPPRWSGTADGPGRLEVRPYGLLSVCQLRPLSHRLSAGVTPELKHTSWSYVCSRLICWCFIHISACGLSAARQQKLQHYRCPQSSSNQACSVSASCALQAHPFQCADASTKQGGASAR
jgi:hypothetical protein